MPTPNMAITTPTVSSTPGPTWASILNAAFDTVDDHDHTTGKGVRIPTAGLNINASLSFNSWNATTLRSARFDDQSATLSDSTDLRIIYVKNGELCYRDASGNEVVITAAGSVAGASGTITGLSSPAAATYSTLNDLFTWIYDTGKPARHALGDILLYPYDGTNAYSTAVSLKAPTTIASSYTWTFPTAAASQGAIVSISTAGQLAYGAAAGTAGAPSIPFTTDLDTGLYLAGANQIGFSCGGALKYSMTADQLLVHDGVVGTPAIAFTSDTDTGFYRASGNELSLAANGSRIAKFDTQGIHSLTGSAAQPSFTTLTDSNSGMYSGGADVLSFAVGGALRLNLSLTGLDVQLDGSASAPCIYMNGDSNTGFYRPADNQIGIAIGGAESAYFTSGGLTVGPSSNGAFKVKVFTGTLAAGAQTSLAGPGTLIVGVFGWTQMSNSGYYGPLSLPIDTGGSVPDTNSIQCDTLSTSNSLALYNSGSTTATYRVVMFYQ